MTHGGDEVATGILIRSAVIEDYAGVVELWRAAGLSVRLTGREAADAFRRQVEHFPGLYLIAQDKAHIVGVVWGTHDQRKGWINRLAVHPAYRRRGIARALVNRCERALAEAGMEIIAALVEPENAGSLAVFRDLGYQADAPVIYLRKLSRPDA